MENNLANILKDCIHTSFENVEKTIQELSNHLHTNHYIYVLAKRHLIRMYGLDIPTQTTEKLELREKLCQEVRNSKKIFKNFINLVFFLSVTNHPSIYLYLFRFWMF